MAHLHLTHFVSAHRQGGAKRRRGIRARPVRPNHANELWYKAKLIGIAKRLQTVTREELLPFLKSQEPGYARDAASGGADAKIDAMSRHFGGIEGVAQRLAAIAVQRARESVDEQLIASIRQAMGVDITGALTGAGQLASTLQEALQTNIELITSIPEKYFDLLSERVAQGMEQGIRYEALKSVVSHLGEVTESRAKLIARDQTSKMNGAFNRIRQSSIGIDRYTWQTAEDERVRDTHADLDGTVQSWDEPTDVGYPGDDFQCRCVAIPYLEDVEPDEDSEPSGDNSDGDGDYPDASDDYDEA